MSISDANNSKFRFIWFNIMSHGSNRRYGSIHESCLVRITCSVQVLLNHKRREGKMQLIFIMIYRIAVFDYTDLNRGCGYDVKCLHDRMAYKLSVEDFV